MDEPVLWGALLATAVVGAGLRLVARRPLWPRHSCSFSRVELAAAGVAVVVLQFHCAAMFFAGWVDAVPFAETPARSVRELAVVSALARFRRRRRRDIISRQRWSRLMRLCLLEVGAGESATDQQHP